MNRIHQSDADPTVQQRLYGFLRSLSVEEHLSRMFNLCTFGRQIMLADIRAKNPKQTFVKVDFFTKLGDFELDQFGRAAEYLIPGTDTAVRVSGAEYNILAKLRWYEMSG